MNPFLIAQQPIISSAPAGVINMFREVMGKLDILNRPDDLLNTLQTMPFFGAAVIIVVGILCVLYGYRWHKWVIATLAFLGGWWLGVMLSAQFGKSSIVAIALASLCAIVATPMLKLAVAIFGGITGAFIGANAWSAFNQATDGTQWAGALMGFIVLAMASFILFRVVIVLFTSIGGAAMIVFGIVTLLLQNDSWAPAVRASLEHNRPLLPLLVTVAAVGGIVLQNYQNHTDEVEAEGH